MKSLQINFEKHIICRVCVLVLISALLATGCSIKDKLQNFSFAHAIIDVASDSAAKNTHTPFEHLSPELASFYQPVIRPNGVITQGPLDSTFNGSGMSMLSFGETISNAKAHAVAIQADGKIVAVGNAYSVKSDKNGNVLVALARYSNDGRLDSTFGKGGMVTTRIDTHLLMIASAAAIQTDGKIVVGGGAISNISKSFEFILLRYNIDGSLDTSFGAGGIASKSVVDLVGIKSIAIQADSKIIVLGNESTKSGAAFTLLRFNKEGGIDSTFGEGGKVNTQFSRTNDSASAVAIQADGKIVAVGASIRIRGRVAIEYDFSLARYNANGSLDTNFGVGGRMTTDAGGSEMANVVAIQADGKIVVAGTAGEQPLAGKKNLPQGGIGLVRYNPNGSIDQTFAKGGMVKRLRIDSIKLKPWPFNRTVTSLLLPAIIFLLYVTLPMVILTQALVWAVSPACKREELLILDLRLLSRQMAKLFLWEAAVIDTNILLRKP